MKTTKESLKFVLQLLESLFIGIPIVLLMFLFRFLCKIFNLVSTVFNRLDNLMIKCLSKF